MRLVGDFLVLHSAYYLHFRSFLLIRAFRYALVWRFALLLPRRNPSRTESPCDSNENFPKTRGCKIARARVQRDKIQRVKKSRHSRGAKHIARVNHRRRRYKREPRRFARVVKSKQVIIVKFN